MKTTLTRWLLAASVLHAGLIFTAHAAAQDPAAGTTEKAAVVPQTAPATQDAQMPERPTTIGVPPYRFFHRTTLDAPTSGPQATATSATGATLAYGPPFILPPTPLPPSFNPQPPILPIDPLRPAFPVPAPCPRPIAPHVPAFRSPDPFTTAAAMACYEPLPVPPNPDPFPLPPDFPHPKPRKPQPWPTPMPLA